MKAISTDGTDLYGVDRGAGVPLLLVHGFPLDHTMWAAQIEGLAECFAQRNNRGLIAPRLTAPGVPVRVIAPDLCGFGRSTARGTVPIFASAKMGLSPSALQRETVTMQQFADDLAALLDRLKIDEPIVLCGLSMGGYIALQFWRKYAARLRGLVLCDTRAAADGPEAAAARCLMADRVLREGPAPLVETMMPKVLGETTRREHPEMVEGVRRVMMAADRRGIAAAARGMAERPDMTAALAEIRCPTLVMAGSEDVTSTPAEMRGMAEAISGSTFVEIPAAGHLSPLENPAAVNAALAEFYRQL